MIFLMLDAQYYVYKIYPFIRLLSICPMPDIVLDARDAVINKTK